MTERSSRVIVVGSINVDLTVKVKSLPGPGETVIGGRFVQSPGGKGGNQATAAALLGAHTSIVGSVGDDSLGEMALADLERAGVDVSEVTTSSVATGVAAILVDERGENLIAVASGANEQLTGAMVESALDRLPLEGAVVLAVLEVPDEAVSTAARTAKRNGASFVLNPAPARPLSEGLVSLCDVLTPNEHELAVLGSADGLLGRGAGAVVVTRGAAGAEIVRLGAEPRHQPAYPVDAVDTTGAGDAFSAALACGLAEGASLEQAVTLATAAGALATRAVGARAGLPTRAELEGLLPR